MDGNIGTWGEVELEKQIAESRTHPPKAQESKNSSSLKEGNARVYMFMQTGAYFRQSLIFEQYLSLIPKSEDPTRLR